MEFGFVDICCFWIFGGCSLWLLINLGVLRYLVCVGLDGLVGLRYFTDFVVFVLLWRMFAFKVVVL